MADPLQVETFHIAGCIEHLQDKWSAISSAQSLKPLDNPRRVGRYRAARNRPGRSLGWFLDLRGSAGPASRC
jgi:hypothetical protein